MNIASQFTLETIEWADPTPIARERIVAGQPTASTTVLHDDAGNQVGFWRVSPGVFHTDHTGYLEYIHILSGSGELVDSEGVATSLHSGVTVLMQPGWKGRWVVSETITKVFTVIHS